MQELGIKRILLMLCLLAGIALVSTSFPAEAQTAHQNAAPSPDAWVSHQMNQPPPGAGDRYDVSSDRLDEISQLYTQAKQEQDTAKKAPKAQDKK